MFNSVNWLCVIKIFVISDINSNLSHASILPTTRYFFAEEVNHYQIFVRGKKKDIWIRIWEKDVEMMLPKATMSESGSSYKWTRGNYFRDNSNANEGPVIFCLGTFLRDMYSPSDVKLIWISIAHRSRGAHVHFFSNQMALNFVHSFLVFLVG